MRGRSQVPAEYGVPRTLARLEALPRRPPLRDRGTAALTAALTAARPAPGPSEAAAAAAWAACKQAMDEGTGCMVDLCVLRNRTQVFLLSGGGFVLRSPLFTSCVDTLYRGL